ncbi:MAG TPA: prepilin-type N-terminal cleavage/methylation domain-containing protein [Pirellulaceae bacterium]|nr:prepilin-type N-terminal cleavage/methylation domain-containing protein [Pirellulaceae bacterium]
MPGATPGRNPACCLARSSAPVRPRLRARRGAFTLVEVMMVLAALAIIAGVVIPQVTGIIDDAKNSAMLRDLRELAVAIERYRMEHNGAAPDLIQNDTLIQLVSKTDMDGNLGSGPECVYGPYMEKLPPNALNNVGRVFRVNTAPPPNLTSRVGWVYHEETGQIWAGLHNGPVVLGP